MASRNALGVLQLAMTPDHPPPHPPLPMTPRTSRTVAPSISSRAMALGHSPAQTNGMAVLATECGNDNRCVHLGQRHDGIGRHQRVVHRQHDHRRPLRFGDEVAQPPTERTQHVEPGCRQRHGAHSRYPVGSGPRRQGCRHRACPGLNQRLAARLEKGPPVRHSGKGLGPTEASPLTTSQDQPCKAHPTMIRKPRTVFRNSTGRIVLAGSFGGRLEMLNSH